MTGGLGQPNSLAVDVERHEVCWSEAGEGPRSARLECVGASGGARRTVITLSPVNPTLTHISNLALATQGEAPYGLAVVGESLVWTDWGRPGLQRADRTTGARQPALPYTLSHIGKPYGVAVAGPACPRLTNTCQVRPSQIYNPAEKHIGWR